LGRIPDLDRLRCAYDIGKFRVAVVNVGKATSATPEFDQKLRWCLTMRLFNGRLVRKTWAFSKDVGMYRALAAWEDLVYNLARLLKT
jgi:hypothetical protein